MRGGDALADDKVRGLAADRQDPADAQEVDHFEVPHAAQQPGRREPVGEREQLPGQRGQRHAEHILQSAAAEQGADDGAEAGALRPAPGTVPAAAAVPVAAGAVAAAAHPGAPAKKPHFKTEDGVLDERVTVFKIHVSESGQVLDALYHAEVLSLNRLLLSRRSP